MTGAGLGLNYLPEAEQKKLELVGAARRKALNKLSADPANYEDPQGAAKALATVKAHYREM